MQFPGDKANVAWMAIDKLGRATPPGVEIRDYSPARRPHLRGRELTVDEQQMSVYEFYEGWVKPGSAVAPLVDYFHTHGPQRGRSELHAAEEFLSSLVRPLTPTSVFGHVIKDRATTILRFHRTCAELWHEYPQFRDVIAHVSNDWPHSRARMIRGEEVENAILELRDDVTCPKTPGGDLVEINGRHVTLHDSGYVPYQVQGFHVVGKKVANLHALPVSLTLPPRGEWTGQSTRRAIRENVQLLQVLAHVAEDATWKAAINDAVNDLKRAYVLSEQIRPPVEQKYASVETVTHADMHALNAVVHGEFGGLIDFDNAEVGPYLRDFEQMIFLVPQKVMNYERDQGQYEEFCDGYRSARQNELLRPPDWADAVVLGTRTWLQWTAEDAVDALLDNQTSGYTTRYEWARCRRQIDDILYCLEAHASGHPERINSRASTYAKMETPDLAGGLEMLPGLSSFGLPS